MNTKRRNFYGSKKWADFTAVLKSERANEQGYIVCEHCGKPILKAYDCIAHHKTELTDANVDDAAIALNPENIALVHFKCHNEIHERFGHGDGSAPARIVKHVYIIYGAPCSGKTTFVNSVATKQDIILDLDRLWGAIRSENCGEYEKPYGLLDNVFALRDCMLDMIRVRRGGWHDAYIVGGYPLRGERERLGERLGADKMIFIDTPKDVCLARAEYKPERWKDFVEAWFERYT